MLRKDKRTYPVSYRLTMEQAQTAKNLLRRSGGITTSQLKLMATNMNVSAKCLHGLAEQIGVDITPPKPRNHHRDKAEALFAPKDNPIKTEIGVVPKKPKEPEAFVEMRKEQEDLIEYVEEIESDLRQQIAQLQMQLKTKDRIIRELATDCGRLMAGLRQCFRELGI